MKKVLRSVAQPRTILAVPLILAGIVVFGGYPRSGSAQTVVQSPQYAPYASARLFDFPGDWEAVPSTTVVLNYPAQSSWQFVTSPQHPGSSSVLAGTACASCHGNPIVGESTVGGWNGPPADHREGVACQTCHGALVERVEDLGEQLVADPRLEPDPIEGKRPWIHVEARAAYDAEYIYMRYAWDSERPGITHDLLRWNGEKWEKAGGPKPDATKKGVAPSYEDRLTLLVSDRDLPAYDGASVGFGTVGCSITCHNSMRAMPLEKAGDIVKADPYLGDQGLKQSDVRKYLLNTRTALDPTGGWNSLKQSDQIAALLRDGEFLDMLMWRAARSGPIGYADDLYVLDYRLRDEGSGPFKTQKTAQYMYDEAKTGFRAIPESKLEGMLNEFALILGDNAVDMDPDASFEVGDLISRRALRVPTESVGDILVNSRWADGRWVIEMRRKLDTGRRDDKAFVPGSVYYVGIAVFDDMVSNRRHHVSFPVTLGLGVDADIRAVPLP